MQNNNAPKVIVGNYFNKHESKNVLFQYLVKGYKRKLQELVSSLPGETILEIGSGEGYILNYIQEVRPDLDMVGSDISHKDILLNSRLHPPVKWFVTKGENLPFQKGAFDLILACEVLEHIENPTMVLDEMKRVAKSHIIISVPQEPVWRILNLLRLKYASDLGNTPGHLNHWSVVGIQSLIGSYFEVTRMETSFPWTFVVGKVR